MRMAGDLNDDPSNQEGKEFALRPEPLWNRNASLSSHMDSWRRVITAHEIRAGMENFFFRKWDDIQGRQKRGVERHNNTHHTDSATAYGWNL